jgi:hypothetical protein
MITQKISGILLPGFAFVLSLIAVPHMVLGELPPYTGGKPLSSGVETSVPFLAPPDYWDRYLIQVWQYETEARRDIDQYRAVGLHAFHIDRGWQQDELVTWARENNLPYYVDHAADKGLLHLTERTGLNEILKKHELLPRPVSLSDASVTATLKDHLRKNVSSTKEGPVLAYSFDDEISLAAFNSPSEVDNSPATVVLYREWLAAKYKKDISSLNQAWGSDHADFSTAAPVSFEGVRPMHNKPPFSKWRLAPWMDWRAFMDSHFAEVLAGLTRYTNSLDPRIPAGFVGAQQPSAYGGYDYNKLGHAVQFLEAYDIDGTNEILRSFWSWPEQRPRVQTWFSNGNANLDRWFHWYYFLHGNRGAIAWPETRGHGPWFGEGREPASFLTQNRGTLEEIQGDLSRTLFEKKARFETDAIAVYYSMPSIRASWVADVVPHGKTWPSRSSSLDNQAQSAGKNRIAWFKLLEDCGYQYNVVSNDQVAAGSLLSEGYRVLILNRALVISEAEADAIGAFVRAGGTVVADYWCGLLDGNGNGRPRGALDDLFGIERAESDRYFGGGDQLCELNGEKYQKPYLERLDYEGAERHLDIVIPERGRRPLLENLIGAGRTVYLNLSPLTYFDHSERFGPVGESWRTILKGILEGAGIHPDITATAMSGGSPFPPVEVLRWDLHNGRQLVGFVMNPSRQGSIDSIGEVGATGSAVLDLELTRKGGWRNAVNRRSGESYPGAETISLGWDPFDAVIIECDR